MSLITKCIPAALLVASAVGVSHAQSKNWQAVPAIQTSTKTLSQATAKTTNGLQSIAAGLSAVGDTLNYFDFDGDLQGWSATDSSNAVSGNVWVFSTTGAAGSFPLNPIASTTETNGYALFDSDLLCSGSQDAYLLSPVLDLSGEDTIELRVQSHYRRFAHNAYVVASADGGATYEQIEVYGDFANNTASDNPDFLKIDLSSILAGSATAIVGFRFESEAGEFGNDAGCGYAWYIDDVAVVNALTPRAEVNLTLDEDFFAVPPAATPASQADILAFVTDIFNDGSASQETRLAVAVTDTGGLVVYTDTLDYGVIVSDSLAENNVFPRAAPMPTEVGDYILTYTVLSPDIDNDAVPEDNTASTSFAITNDLFSASGRNSLRTVSAAASPNYVNGVIYYTPNLAEFDTMYIDSVSFAVSAEGFVNDDQGVFEVTTYGFRGDLNGNEEPDFGTAGNAESELVELATIDYIIDSSFATVDEIITATPSFDGRVFLPADEDYVGFAIALQYNQIPVEEGVTDTRDFQIYANRRTLGASSLAADSLGIEREYTFLQIGTDAADATQYGYFTGLTPFADVKISYNDTTLVQVQELAESAFSVFPNPASTSISISYDFAEVGSVATFRVINAVGQQVRSFTEQSLDGGQIYMPTAGLNNGLYYIKVETATGKHAVRKVFIQR